MARFPRRAAAPAADSFGGVRRPGEPGPSTAAPASPAPRRLGTPSSVTIGNDGHGLADLEPCACPRPRVRRTAACWLESPGCSFRRPARRFPTAHHAVHLVVGTRAWRRPSPSVPCVVSVHTSSSVALKLAGTRTRKTNRLRRGRKCVGWPRSAIADVEAVVGADRHVDLFFPVPVHVAEHEVPGAVGVLLPALVRRAPRSGRWCSSATARRRRGTSSSTAAPSSTRKTFLIVV